MPAWMSVSAASETPVVSVFYKPEAAEPTAVCLCNTYISCTDVKHWSTARCCACSEVLVRLAFFESACKLLLFCAHRPEQYEWLDCVKWGDHLCMFPVMRSSFKRQHCCCLLPWLLSQLQHHHQGCTACGTICGYIKQWSGHWCAFLYSVMEHQACVLFAVFCS